MLYIPLTIHEPGWYPACFDQPEIRNQVEIFTMISKRAFLIGTATLLSGAGLPTLAPTIARAETIKNVSYGSGKLDIYQPENSGNSPILMYVHGGAWRAGSKGRVGSKARYYTRRGYVFVSVGYTLYPRANAEQQAVQIANAVNWVKANASRFGGNPSRIALMGHSAGCHLASLATLSGAATPKLLICNDTGAYDIPYLAEINGGRLPSLYSALNDRSNWTRWSPISYVRNRRQPAAMVIWSGGRNRDRISKRFASALENAGNSVTRYDGSRYTHLSVNSAIGRSSAAVTVAIDNFLKRL